MTKFICDDCKKPLDEPPLILVNELVFLSRDGPSHHNHLHFCNKDCLRSWVVKNAERQTVQLVKP